jgi:hypothetical protein
MRRFWIAAGVVAALLIVVAAAAFAIRGPLTPPSQNQAASCSPQPCVDAGGYRMNVVNVQREDGIVRLAVTFHVSGRNNMHAEPADFNLEKGGRTYHPYNAAAGCTAWPRTEIPDGSSLGPEMVCFKPTSTDGELTLNWDPDLGISEYFSSGYNLTV